MIKIHLDTDIGGDMDDLCALAMLHEIPDPGGIPTRLVTRIDGGAFNEYWVSMICG